MKNQFTALSTYLVGFLISKSFNAFLLHVHIMQASKLPANQDLHKVREGVSERKCEQLPRGFSPGIQKWSRLCEHFNTSEVNYIHILEGPNMICLAAVAILILIKCYTIKIANISRELIMCQALGH